VAQGGDRSFQHVDALHLDVGTAGDQLVAQPPDWPGEEHNPRHDGDMVQSPGELGLRPHQGIGMDHHLDIIELSQSRIGHGVQGFAGGIRNQMDVKFMIHRSYPTCRPACDSAWG
jgi:hypothetical protein